MTRDGTALPTRTTCAAAEGRAQDKNRRGACVAGLGWTQALVVTWERGREGGRADGALRCVCVWVACTSCGGGADSCR
eukprot:scaffold2546_cov118-Isochrysis_galbana.AAC.2